jgi:chemotaxis protein CheX
MDEATAKAIVSAIAGHPVPIFDRMAESGIAELGNVITGMASAGLEAAGYPCNISPPSVISGRGTILSMVNIQSVLLPLTTQFGSVDIHLALRENLKKARLI